MQKIWVLIIILGILSFSACTLRIGSPGVLDDPPAPTAVPLAAAAAGEAFTPPLPPARPIAIPSGFGITVFANGLQGPRMLALGPAGEVYVAERGAGRILRLPDEDGDFLADRQEIVAEGLNAPSSLAFYLDGSLYVGETDRILRLSNPDRRGIFQNREVIIAGLPTGGHTTRTVLFSPDYRYLYVSVGSSCNVCLEDDVRRAAIVRYNPDGSGEELFTVGLRNAVGITFRPGTVELWATNNGRDWLGDDLPPETVNQVRFGDDFGWPRCHAGRIVDPEFGSEDACTDVRLPAVEMQAHTAPLGLEFYAGNQFPPAYQGDLFVALHGSWNRTEPVGYKVVRIPFTGGRPGPVEDFATGWLDQSGQAWGRPVDILTGSDGGLYISDDAGGQVYLIYYPGQD